MRAVEELNVRAEMTKRRSVIGKLIDVIGGYLARAWLFVAILSFHLAWIALNSVPGLAHWDPPPFTLLATVASVEAPLLALLILMRQARDSRIAELRQEILLHLLLEVENKVSQLASGAPVDPKELMQHVRRQLDTDEGNITGERH